MLGRPKLLRSDNLREWRVSSPDSAKAFIGSPVFGHVVFAANDKLYVPFDVMDSSRKIPGGLNLWREP